MIYNEAKNVLDTLQNAVNTLFKYLGYFYAAKCSCTNVGERTSAVKENDNEKRVAKSKHLRLMQNLFPWRILPLIDPTLNLRGIWNFLSRNM